MPTRRGDPRPAGALALVAVAAGAVLVAAGGSGRGAAVTAAAEVSPAGWVGLAGGTRPRVSVGQRVLVVLRAASLADRVSAAGGSAGDSQERKWSNQARAKQKLLIARLSLQGVLIKPEFTYTRVLNGFSAAIDARGLAVLEHAPEVAGVYPVRVAYPASQSSRLLSGAAAAAGSIGLAGVSGRGVTIALLDTGVDRAQPYLRGRVLGGFDVVGRDPTAEAAPKPDDPGQLEEHGTQMAGILVGAGGPFGISGVATGASVLPIRVAGWQADTSGHWSVYSRTDQIVAGLEQAVDPNDDGDAHDAARIALIALAAPYSAFADDPLARAAGGALALDTLVVAPAGNDGVAGPGFGSISGPGGALAALTVGAADLRPTISGVRVVARAGLRVLLDRTAPLGGSATAGRSLTVHVAVPRSGAGRVGLVEFFDGRGYSLVAGRAALVPSGSDPRGAAEAAARAGAAAVLLYGAELPAGGLGLDEDVSVPVVSVSDAAARELRTAIGSPAGATVTIGAAGPEPNVGAQHVAAFSSTGLTFDGTVKPEAVGPGVGVPTASPGANSDGSPRFATVNGSSAAAATVAGAAALLAEARPSLDAGALKSLLVGAAQPLAGDPVSAQGAGLVDVGGAAAAEVAASPATLSLGRAGGAGWRATQTITVRNVSTRTLRLGLTAEHSSEGAAAVAISADPTSLRLARGESAEVKVTASVQSAPVGTVPADGAVRIAISGGSPVRVPWLVAFGARPATLLGPLKLSVRAFKPSDAGPALLTFQAGRLLGRQIVPVRQLDIRLFSLDRGSIGLLARVRDLLPGSYAFGLTGRSPTGEQLAPGEYTLRVIAYPTDGGPDSVRSVHLRIK